MWPFGETKLRDFNSTLPREHLIRTSRILIIDDEKPQLIDDLQGQGFAIDFDETGKKILDKAEKGFYDLLLLDFAGVGTHLGGERGRIGHFKTS